MARNKLSQQQQLRQQQRLQLSQKQLQMLTMLECSTQELRELVSAELQSNPALDEVSSDATINEPKVEDYDPDFDDEDYYPQYQNFAYSDKDRKPIIDNDAAPAMGLADYLIEQLSGLELSPQQLSLCSYLCHNLDAKGYLPDSVYAVVDSATLEFGREISAREINEALSVVQQLEPSGVGARDIKECLLIQLRALTSRQSEQKENIALAATIVDEFFSQLDRADSVDFIAKNTGCSVETVKKALALIATLNPAPGANFGDAAIAVRSEGTPDIKVDIINGHPVVSLNEYAYTPLKIDAEFESAKEECAKADAAVFETYIAKARDFIENLQNRDATLLRIAKAIVQRQEAFFLTGQRVNLRPMKQRDIAEAVGCHISVVSRAVRSKLVFTHWGAVELKALFTNEAVAASGETISTAEIKEALQTIIDEEDKTAPLSDEAIAKYLAEKGYEVSRRTVAKYRAQLNIPTKSERFRQIEGRQASSHSE